MISCSGFFALIIPEATSAPDAPNSFAILISSSLCIPAPHSISVVFVAVCAVCSINRGLALLIEMFPPINSEGSTAT